MEFESEISVQGFESEISAEGKGRQVYPAQWGESRYASGVLDAKVYTQRKFKSEVTNPEDYSSASGSSDMKTIEAYWNDIFKYLPYLGHSSLGRSKWWFFRTGYAKAKSQGATKSIRDNMKKDKAIIVKEAAAGKSMIDAAKSSYNKIKAYYTEATTWYNRAKAAKAYAQKSPRIPNVSKRRADKSANDAIKKYDFLKVGWNKAQASYEALKIVAIEKAASTQTWDINKLSASIVTYSTDADMRVLRDRLKEIENNMRKDRDTVKSEADRAERLSKKELGGRFWDKIKKFNPILAGVRNLILVVIKLNIISMASKMNTLREMAKTDEKKEASWKQIEYAWLQWGGNLSSLNKNIDTGKNKKPVGGKKSKFSGAEGPGDEPTFSTAKGLQGAAVAAGGTVAAAAPPTAPFVAGAVPIIITILEIMQDAGMFSKKELEDIAEGGAGEGGEATGEGEQILGLPKKTVIIGGASVAAAVVIAAVAVVALKSSK